MIINLKAHDNNDYARKQTKDQNIKAELDCK